MGKRKQGGDRPPRFDDLPWRIKHRIKTTMLWVWGPAQLSGHSDPLVRMEQERRQRIAARTRRRRGDTSAE